MVSLRRHLLRVDYHGRVTPPGRATQLLRRLRGGDPHVAAELAPLLVDELRRLAERVVPRSQPRRRHREAALVRATWQQLVDEQGPRWDGRSHFLCVAAKALRAVRVAGARRRSADGPMPGSTPARAPRGPDAAAAPVVAAKRVMDLPALEQALVELERLDPELVRVVELGFFAGLRRTEIAEVTGSSPSAVRRDWETARAWLFSRIGRSKS